MAITSVNRVTTSVYLDVNTRIDLNGQPDLLPDAAAINNSLYNLFACPVGARGPIFQPEYGTNLIQLIHEPLDNITANKIKAYLIQAIQRWEPRITIDMMNTSILPDTTNNRFQATVYYSLNGLQANSGLSLQLSRT